MFTDALIGEIRGRAIEIYEQVLEQSVDTSRDPNAICPFHPDRSPSLYVSPEGLWYCQPCAMGGDVFKFLEQALRLDSFPACVRAACELLGIPVPTVKRGWDPGRDVHAVTIRGHVKRVRAIVKAWYSSRIRELVVRSEKLSRTSRQLWTWASDNNIPGYDSIWDKCVDWASEAAKLKEELGRLDEARAFDAQLAAFEAHHGKFVSRQLRLTDSDWREVRVQLVELRPAAPVRRGPGLFGETDVGGAPEGDHRPEQVEAVSESDAGTDGPDHLGA